MLGTTVNYKSTLRVLLPNSMQLKPLLTFLTSLTKHNDRAWFQERKPTYDQLRKQFEEDAEFWFQSLQKLDPALAGPLGRKSIFRIYRDVRFSNNKDPYKTHFSAYFTASGKDIETPGYYVQVGPNGNTLIGGTNVNLENGGGSMEQNSSMHYLSHDWHGFSLEYNYGFSGHAGNHTDGAEIGYTVNYANGPVLLLASYDGINSLDNSGTFKTILVGGSIDWSSYGVPLKTNLGYQTNKGTDLIGGQLVDSTDLLMGLRIPMGPHEILFSYIHLDNKALDGNTANQFALGYTYALSKRTSFYTSIGEVFNKNGAEYTLGNASNPGYGVKAFDLGMRHSF